MKNLRTLFFALIVAMSPITALANPPAEITKHFSGPGSVLAVYDLLSDSDLKHIVVIQYGNLLRDHLRRLEKRHLDFLARTTSGGLHCHRQ
jgi:hypothetical protein